MIFMLFATIQQIDNFYFTQDGVRLARRSYRRIELKSSRCVKRSGVHRFAVRRIGKNPPLAGGRAPHSLHTPATFFLKILFLA
jgi:hypothetical protein